MTGLFAHHEYLLAVAQEDVRFLKEKDRSYGASWKLAGGRSAWFMLRRKMDRMIAMLARPDEPASFAAADGPSLEDVRYLLTCYRAEDIFAKVEEDPSGRDGCVLAEVRDLRRYLLLVEAEMVARGAVVAPAQPQEPAPERKVPRYGNGGDHPRGFDPAEDIA